MTPKPTGDLALAWAAPRACTLSTSPTLHKPTNPPQAPAQLPQMKRQLSASVLRMLIVAHFQGQGNNLREQGVQGFPGVVVRWPVWCSPMHFQFTATCPKAILAGPTNQPLDIRLLPRKLLPFFVRGIKVGSKIFGQAAANQKIKKKKPNPPPDKHRNQAGQADESARQYPASFSLFPAIFPQNRLFAEQKSETLCA